MKFKVIFLKKKYLYYLILVIVFIVMLVVFLTTNKTTATFNTINENKTIKADFTGDGSEDILYINTNKDKYFMEMNTKNSSVALKPNEKYNSLGCYYCYWPMRVTLMDISRNKTPEIFVQSSQKGTPIQHIFVWKENGFKDVFFSSNSIIGFIDSQNNKTPKFISGTISGNKIIFSNHILIKDSMNTYNCNYKDNFVGKDTIYAFIKYIEGLPNNEANKPKDIFFEGLTGTDISVISKLATENNTYTFQDATFQDMKYNKDGELSEIEWLLNFKSVSNTDNTNCKNYNIKVTVKSYLKADENFCFKISSLNAE